MAATTTGVEFRSEFLRTIQSLKAEVAQTSPATHVGAEPGLAAVIGADRPTERE